jgi:glycosyltransferase involved in cell wall biosynthesis
MPERYPSDKKADFIADRLAQAKEILETAGALISPSRFLAGMFVKEFPNLKLEVIPHGMDYRYLEPNRKHYSRKDEAVLAYCGTLSPHKGIHLLLEAFLQLNPQNARLELYGSSFHETDYFNHLKKIAGKDSRIKFRGAYTNTQVGEILAGIDVLVLPSLCYENYPLALHEALACGVPVIASDIGGMAEKVKDSVNGFTFRFGDRTNLADKMKMILDSPEILNHLKKNIFDSPLPPVEEEAYLYIRLYRKVINPD